MSSWSTANCGRGHLPLLPNDIGSNTAESHKMEIKLCVRNLSKSTTSAELAALFAQVGTVIAVHLIKDRWTDTPKGYAFITMSAQNEADQAVSKFNAYPLNDQELKVKLATPRAQFGFSTTI